MLICPKCGKTSDEKEFIEAFCIDCFQFNIKLPKGLKVEQCGRCERLRLHGEWQQFNRRKLSEYIVGKCKGEFVEAAYDPDLGVCTFTFEKGSRRVSVQRSVEPEKITTICPNCSRTSGGYYEALIQLRGEAENVEKIAQRLERQLSKKTFISKTEEMHGGLNLYLGSSKVTATVLQELGFKPTISRKLFGKKDGKNLYRVTYALRL